MARFTSPLNNVRVSSPCSANWDEMYGTDRKRLCGQCDMNVYNLSAMTRQEAESLIMNAEGRLCARFYRRPDGTILTKDCPVGWRAAKRRVRKFWSAAVSLVFTLLAGIGIASLIKGKAQSAETGSIRVVRPFNEPVMGNVAIEDPYVMGEVVPPDHNSEMGKVATPDRN